MPFSFAVLPATRFSFARRSTIPAPFAGQTVLSRIVFQSERTWIPELNPLTWQFRTVTPARGLHVDAGEASGRAR